MSESTHEATIVDAEPARPVTAGHAPTRSDRARTSAYRHRFAVVYLLLAAVAGLGIGAFVLLAGEPAEAPPAAWSSFEPDGSSQARVKQIADRVSSGYRLPSGAQLAAAWGGPPRVTATTDGSELPVSAIVVRPDASTGQAEETDYRVITSGGNVMYILCGLGESCSIASGEASPERLSLLRREALELALYTFRYVDDADTVTVLLPPSPTGDSAVSVFFERRDLASMLDRPLAETLAAKAPTVGGMTTRELAAVHRATRERLYSYAYQQSQDLSALLVLSQIPPA